MILWILITNSIKSLKLKTRWLTTVCPDHWVWFFYWFDQDIGSGSLTKSCAFVNCRDTKVKVGLVSRLEQGIWGRTDGLVGIFGIRGLRTVPSKFLIEGKGTESTGRWFEKETTLWTTESYNQKRHVVRSWSYPTLSVDVRVVWFV